jgi:hypothetical protein
MNYVYLKQKLCSILPMKAESPFLALLSNFEKENNHAMQVLQTQYEIVRQREPEWVEWIASNSWEDYEELMLNVVTTRFNKRQEKWDKAYSSPDKSDSDFEYEFQIECRRVFDDLDEKLLRIYQIQIAKMRLFWPEYIMYLVFENFKVPEVFEFGI